MHESALSQDGRFYLILNRAQKPSPPLSRTTRNSLKSPSSEVKIIWGINECKKE